MILRRALVIVSLIVCLALPAAADPVQQAIGFDRTSRAVCALEKAPSTKCAALGWLDSVRHFFQPKAGRDPRDYGAVCDGVGDDTAALQTWASATQPGDRLALPNSVCLFKGPLVFPLVDGVTLAGEGRASTLRYAGASTTTTLVTIGTVAVPAGGCAVKYWTIRDLRIDAATTMTAGTGLMLGHLCETEIRNISVGEDIGGNSNLWDGIHFSGGNSVRMRGYSLRASNVAETVTGDDTYTFTDLYQGGGGKIAKSRIGLLVGGAVGGLTVNDTDILLNGENVRIDQSIVSAANRQIFFGPGVAIDETQPIGGWTEGIGVRLNDPGAYSSELVFSGTWLASAQKSAAGDDAKCLWIAAPSTNWRVVFTGGRIGNCDGDGIRSDSATVRLTIVGTHIGDNNSKYGVNQTTSNPAVKISGVSWGFNGSGNWSSNVLSVTAADRVQAAGTLLLNGRSGGAVALGLAGTNGVWVQSGAMIPGSATAAAPGGTTDLGSAAYPFGALWAGEVHAPLTTPASSSAACTPGKIVWDASAIYVCTAAATWKRAPLAAY